MKKHFFIAIAIALSMQNSFGQSQVPGLVQPLQIGDTMPDILISGIENYEKTSVKFSAFKNKLVLLDFWFGFCKGCLKMFPKVEKLQQRFKDSIQILMVNYESREQVDSIFNKLRKRSYLYRKPKLPSITGDTIFHKLFKFAEYPHQVWIDGAGVVKAFTSASDVNEENIAAMLRKDVPRMDRKWEDLSFNDAEPLFPQLTKRNAPMLYYSCIFPYVEGLYGGQARRIVDSASLTVRVSRRNMSRLELFGNAIGRGGGWNPFEAPQFDFGKRVILNVLDSSQYFYEKADSITLGEWKKKNCYNYESVFPLAKEPMIFTYQLQDLERFFGVRCRLEKRKMKCLALIRTSGKDKIKSTKKPRHFYDTDRRDTTLITLYSSMTNWFLHRVSTENKHTPFVFVDNTGYTGRIDIEVLKKNITNIPELKKELRRKYDLDFIETEQDVDCFVLTELSLEGRNASALNKENLQITGAR